MALGREVVYFIGLHFLDDPDEIAPVGEIPVVKHEMTIFYMGILIEMVHPLCVEHGSPSLHPVDFIPFLEQKFGQICPVLTCNAGDERSFCHGFFSSSDALRIKKRLNPID